MRIPARAARCATARAASLLALLLVGTAGPVAAQNAVYHGGTSSDDGDPGKDLDGVKNGTAVWAAGKVHLVDPYSVSGGFVDHELVAGTLVIQAGAIVRFGGSFRVTNGHVTRWAAPSGAWMPASGAGTIRINGAIITDIRAGIGGGDTNGDGGDKPPTARRPPRT